MRKFFTLLIASCFSFGLFLSTTYALSMSSENFELELAPGQTYKSSMRLTNSSDLAIDVNVEIASAIINASGRRVKIDETNSELPEGHLLKNWIQVSPLKLALNPGEAQNIDVVIDVPEDVSPGDYHAIITMKELPAGTDNSGTGLGVSTAIAKTIDIIIAGDIERKVDFLSFEIDDEAAKAGEIAFVSKFINSGGVPETISARIEIYDQEGNKIEKIVKRIDEQGEIETLDNINVSFPSQYIFPGAEVEVKTAWKNRNIPAGDYIAKIAGFWGTEKTFFEKEAAVSVSENVEISAFSADHTLFQTLPATFTAKIANKNPRATAYKASLSIKNLFGVSIYETDVTKNDGFLLGEQETVFSGNDLEWNEGFTLGAYTATFKLTYGESNTILEETTTFYVMTWWQILIAIAILVLIVLIVYKGISSYRKMRKKIAKLEHK